MVVKKLDAIESLGCAHLSNRVLQGAGCIDVECFIVIDTNQDHQQTVSVAER